MTTPSAADAVPPGHDPLPEALALAGGAARAGLGLKLLGGLAVRVLAPDFPPRLRRDQDIDFACLSRERKQVAAHLAQAGCEPDRRFNNLNGDRQLYFTAPSGRPVDVMVDRLAMCHTLDLRPSFRRLPLTVDAMDVLLSKLQIVQLNEKDVRDIVHLLAGAVRPAGAGAAAAGTRPGSTQVGQVEAALECWGARPVVRAAGGSRPLIHLSCLTGFPPGARRCTSRTALREMRGEGMG